VKPLLHLITIVVPCNGHAALHDLATTQSPYHSLKGANLAAPAVTIELVGLTGGVVDDFGGGAVVDGGGGVLDELLGGG